MTPPLRALAVAGLTAVAALAPSSASGQGCTWVDPTRSYRIVTIPGQGQVVYLGAPSIRCSDGVRFRADTAVAYAAQSMTHLMGHVRFDDGAKELTSNEARYFSQQGRLQATGSTLLRDTVQGSEIRDGDIVLLRANNIRDKEQITVTTGPDGVRPRARLYMNPAPAPDSVGATDSLAARADSAAAALEPPARPRRERPDTAKTPYLVVGDRLFLQGDEYFLASGQVEIERDSLTALADTAEYDQVASRMLLKGHGRVEGSSYTLTGRTVNIALSGGDMSGVRASRDAVLVGEGLRLAAPLIQLFLVDGAMERLVATPLPGDPAMPPATAEDSATLARPVAEAEQFTLTADSVEVMAPGEVLDRIFAAGGARGESSARDSLNVESLPALARTDWLEGDTIIARFSRPEPDPDLPPDTAAEEYRLDELVARGSAKSLYRMLPSDSTARPGVDAPAVHYVTGKSIRIVMAEGEVDSMEVEGPTRGWHLEPTSAKADSLAKADSVPPPDTGSASAGAGGSDTKPPGLAPWREGTRESEQGDRGAAALPGAAPEPRARRRRSRR